MKILTTIALILLCLSAKSQSFSDYESYCLKQKIDSIENGKKHKCTNYHYGITKPLVKTKNSQEVIEKKCDDPISKKKKIGIGQPVNSTPTIPSHTIPLFYFFIK